MYSRRQLLKSAASGFGYLAFAALAHEQAIRQSRAESPADSPLAPKPTKFAARAKRVIFLCMDGGPSHVDSFQYKPKLNADDGKPFGRGKLLGSPFAFQQRGESGLWISDIFPEVAKHADDLCLLNGMHTDLPNHPQAYLQMHCGVFQFPRPSLGAWVLYGLGTENANVPGFVTFNPPSSNGGAANYGSSFLPAVYQGTKIGGGRFGGEPNRISNLKSPSRSSSAQRVQLDYLQELNRSARENGIDSAAVEGVIDSYELAFRMQAELPQLMDLSTETKATQDLYGIANNRPRSGFGGGFGGGMFGAPASDGFARQCLLARKLVEGGVRFVEINVPGWDHHRDLKGSMERSCGTVDKPIAALLGDLKQRGLLDDTLVMWGGEFGRSPVVQGGDGRDHNAKGYTIWMAGGGVKGGMAHGRTDDYGAEAVEGKVHIHDWHATILHLLGLDSERLIYNYAGREMKITDVKGGTVVKEVLA